MANRWADRLRQTSTTSGTDDYVLQDVTDDWRGFVAGLGDASTSTFMATDGAQFEVFWGTVDEGPPHTISRDTVIINSSGTTSKINWGPGTRTIACVVPAELMGAIGGIMTTASTGGTASALTLDLPIRPRARVTGSRFRARAHADVDASATLNLTGSSGSGLGAVTLKKYAGGSKVDLGAGDWKSGQAVEIEDDGTHYVVMSMLGGGVPTTAAQVDALGEGEHQVCVTARFLRPAKTNGCAALDVLESSTNKVHVEYLAFDPSAAEYAVFAMKAPKSSDETAGIYVKNLAWTHPSTTTNFGVSWKVQFLARSNDDAIDTAYGTAIEMADTGGTTHDIYVAPDSAVITPGGTWAEGDWLFGRIQRDPADGNDTMAVDAWLIGFDIVFTIAAANDA